MQNMEYQVFIFSPFDNNVNCVIAWSNEVNSVTKSEDRAKDLEDLREKENREMSVVVHGTKQS